MHQRKNWVILFLVIYAVVWSILAISPVNRLNWVIENGLIFAFLITIWAFYKHIPFSILSYFTITVFLSLHTIGAHYSYRTSLDIWLHLKRAYYDRIVHFSFGFCFFLPVLELLHFSFPLKKLRSTIVFVNLLLLSASALYEIFEVWVVCLVAPKTGALFLGLQGDQWDAQHDMEIALLGSILASIIYLVWQKNKKQTDQV